jgi:hypothetical protein
MRAVYTISNCCGDLLDTIEVELPAGFDDPSDFDAECYALDQSDHADQGTCNGCGSPATRASYWGFPLDPVPAVVSIEAVDRDGLIETLESLLTQVRDLPEYVGSIDCSGCKNVAG